jgi:hypothetical protein
MLYALLTEAAVADWRARGCHAHRGACDLDMISGPDGEAGAVIETTEGMNDWCPWIASRSTKGVACHAYFLMDRRRPIVG